MTKHFLKIMRSKTRIKILVSYKGQRYYGWQKQTNLPTVQGQIEWALKEIFQTDMVVVGASRTDTGAHALGQTAHFDIVHPLQNKLFLQKALNSFLVPKDICVRGVWKTPENFHALRSSIGKQYVYFILNRSFPCVFRKGQIDWQINPLNIQLLQDMSRTIQGRHDFSSFQNAGSPVRSAVRTIYSTEWKKLTKHILAFYIHGDGFLKQMIRNLVGTQIALSRQTAPLKKWKAILRAKDRTKALQTAPAEGLYLQKVFYPAELDKKCQKI